jgi:leucyl aminopeptidase
MTVKLTQYRRQPETRQFDKLGNWIIILAEGAADSAWTALPHGAALRALRDRQPAAASGERPPVFVDLDNAATSRVGLATVKPDAESFDLLTLARKLVAGHKDFQPEVMGVCVAGFRERVAERVAEALLAALLAAAAEMPDYRSKKVERRRLQQIHLYGSAPAHRFRRSFAEADGNALARYLATLPPNELTPAMYRARLETLAGEHGLEMEFLDVETLRQKGAGAFLAVCQGSPEPDAGIARLRYVPKRKTRQAAVALVGKGICFDTGGVNVKPGNFMLGMQGDMQGSAVALGTLIALATLKVDFPVDAWLALAMNHVGPNAYKPTDVVKAANGTTIEVIHTDAEGRMILSDTLALCSRTGPGMIIDYATLTGSCVRALGKAYSGAFTNRRAFWPTLIEAGRASGERIWPFPIDKDYDQALESGIADVRQCAEEAPADHILAARFLSRFVGESIPWVHLDLSAASNKDGLAHVPTHFNGFGVRLTLQLLLDQGLARA